MDHFDLALIGFGNVGQALAELLLEKETSLRSDYDLTYRVTVIATARHGVRVDPNGLDLSLALADRHDTEKGEPIPEEPDILSLIETCPADVIFENTPVNYEDGQPAMAHVETALRSGKHIVTANKGPVVFGYRQLTDLANSKGLRFRFESTVMDGAPIFALWRETLQGAVLRSFRGVLNSTTNLVLTLMEDGLSFEGAIEHAQSIGIAETDPSGDIDGWDAAIKTAALATVLMDTPLRPVDVERTGIRHLHDQDLRATLNQGQRWKLICTAERTDTGATSSVRPELIDASDPLFNLHGTSSAITLTTDVLGDLTLQEDNPGTRTTAYGLLADFLSIASQR